MAAACESLQIIFENRLPESPKISDLFPRLPLKENPPSPFHHLAISLSSNSIFNDFSNHAAERFSSINKSQSLLSFSNNYTNAAHKKSDSATSLDSLCSEGVGSKSCEDVDDDLSNTNDDTNTDDYWQMKGSINTRRHSRRSSWSSNGNGDFPPPISCIGRAGRPWVFFKTYRNHKRVILKEVRIPTHEFLEACREGGHLRLHFIQPDDDLVEEDEDAEEQDEDDEERDKQEEEEDEKQDGSTEITAEGQDEQKEGKDDNIENTAEGQDEQKEEPDDNIETTADGQDEQKEERDDNIETTVDGQDEQKEEPDDNIETIVDGQDEQKEERDDNIETTAQGQCKQEQQEEEELDDEIETTANTCECDSL